MNTPLSRFAPSPLFGGRGDNADGRRRSGRGVRWFGLLSSHPMFQRCSPRAAIAYF